MEFLDALDVCVCVELMLLRLMMITLAVSGIKWERCTISMFRR